MAQHHWWYIALIFVIVGQLIASDETNRGREICGVICITAAMGIYVFTCRGCAGDPCICSGMLMFVGTAAVYSRTWWVTCLIRALLVGCVPLVGHYLFNM